MYNKHLFLVSKFECISLAKTVMLMVMYGYVMCAIGMENSGEINECFLYTPCVSLMYYAGMHEYNSLASVFILLTRSDL